MSRIDHTVQCARQHLAADEVVMSAALGFEVDGRRRQLLLLTDRRVLLVGLRGDTPKALSAIDGGRAARTAARTPALAPREPRDP